MESVDLILTENWRNCSQNHLLCEEAQRSGASLYLEGSETRSTAKANWHWMSTMGSLSPSASASGPVTHAHHLATLCLAASLLKSPLPVPGR